MAVQLPSAPAVVCHHCGQDYARAYWIVPAGDPFVCQSCRRDTNPDAADAPRWTPGAYADETPDRALLVTRTRKLCRMCRGEWDGLIFGSAPQGLPLPFGICPTCGAADDARRTAPRVVPMGMPLPELSRPRRTETDD